LISWKHTFFQDLIKKLTKQSFQKYLKLLSFSLSMSGVIKINIVYYMEIYPVKSR
jgi:hypothetical protein